MRKGSFFGGFLLLLAACDVTATVDQCRCEGAVPEGTLSVACGQTQCVGGTAGYLCLGDNSAQSSDSRKWGTVPDRLMLGKAVFVFWPANRIGFIK